MHFIEILHYKKFESYSKEGPKSTLIERYKLEPWHCEVRRLVPFLFAPSPELRQILLGGHTENKQSWAKVWDSKSMTFSILDVRLASCDLILYTIIKFI